ncbi:hypothetical protein IQ13_0944 [Lacibacter cauensis]|uniref:Uncharacterized protein n=1 Tax=Lacibacter cauensis TaxID=510947 RepID=A0A562SWV5_9BACT|nr:hypothetical protein [Lacibacter cauensis]TWI85775.1 hypothetical protein IQ13_0944 [Lacibacter cauensis]
MKMIAVSVTDREKIECNNFKYCCDRIIIIRKGITGTKRRLKFDHSFSGAIKEGWLISADLFD